MGANVMLRAANVGMKLAFSTLACPAWSLDQVVDAAGAYGYGGVELRMLDGQLIDGAIPAAERVRVRRVLARAGLPVVALDTSVRVAAAADTATALAELRPMLELACDWEAHVVRVFGGDWDAGRAREAAIGQARDVMSEAADVARRLGVTVALETHDRFADVALVAEVLAGLPSAAAAVWDVAHAPDPRQVMSTLGDRVAHVHVKDRRADGTLTLLGEGDVPVRSCIDALAEARYAGWISVEWEKHWHPELVEPEVALPQFASVLKGWDATG
jgi:sugar phosphate isomerase/epimerase